MSRLMSLQDSTTSLQDVSLRAETENEEVARLLHDRSNLTLEERRMASKPFSKCNGRSRSPHRACGGLGWLGFVPVSVPLVGLSTFLALIAWSCSSRFDCSKHYPTLSYAAEHYPEGHVFQIGMNVTAINIGVTLSLVSVLALRKSQRTAVRVSAKWVLPPVTFVISLSLSLLALLDMKKFHFWHILFSSLFFVSAWVGIIIVHSLRGMLLREGVRLKLAIHPERRIGLEMGQMHWVLLGGYFIRVGLSSSALFLYSFLAVNSNWYNPIGLTATHEAAAELLAIVCQLFFVGTCWPEVMAVGKFCQSVENNLLSSPQDELDDEK